MTNLFQYIIRNLKVSLVVLLLSSLIAYEIVSFGYLMLTNNEQKLHSPTEDSTTLKKDKEITSTYDVEKLAAAQVFGKEIQPIETENIPTVSELPNLTIEGIIHNSNNQDSLALINFGEEGTVVVATNDQLADGSVILKIEENAVVIDRGENVVRLLMEWEKADLTGTEFSTIAQTRSQALDEYIQENEVKYASEKAERLLTLRKQLVESRKSKD